MLTHVYFLCSNGQLRVSPLSGAASHTDFTVTTSGWTDDPAMLPLSFSVSMIEYKEVAGEDLPSVLSRAGSWQSSVSRCAGVFVR